MITARILSTILLLMMCVSVEAQTSKMGNDTGSLDSYNRGRATVERALRAMGGPDALDKVRSLSLVAEGIQDAAAEYQGMEPDSSDPVKYIEQLIIDLPNDRLGYEKRHTRGDGTEEWIRFVYQKNNQLLFTHLTDRFAFLGQNPSFEDERQRLARMVPHFLLESALRNAASLRYLGQKNLSGRPHDLVLFSFDSGETITLVFDGGRGLLKGFEYLVDFSLMGDAVVRWEYADYREVPGIGLYPSGYRITLGGRTFKDVKYTGIKTEKVGEAELFNLPEDIKSPSPPAPPSKSEPTAERPRWPRVTEVASGVYYVEHIRSGSHAMFVEFGDFLMALDAPTGYLELHMVPAKNFARGATSSSVSEELIRVMKETVPGKPIRYAVVSHFHSDHAGGLRAFIAEGAKIVTTGDARALYERAARNRHTISPDLLSRQFAQPQFEIVDGRLTVSDDRQEVEIIEVGPNPHAKGLLIINLPREKILFVADLFEPLPMRVFPSKAHVPIMKFFVDWMEAKGMKPEKIYGAHGNGAGTHEHIERIKSFGNR